MFLLSLSWGCYPQTQPPRSPPRSAHFNHPDLRILIIPGHVTVFHLLVIKTKRPKCFPRREAARVTRTGWNIKHGKRAGRLPRF